MFTRKRASPLFIANDRSTAPRVSRMCLRSMSLPSNSATYVSITSSGIIGQSRNRARPSTLLQRQSVRIKLIRSHIEVRRFNKFYQFSPFTFSHSCLYVLYGLHCICMLYCLCGVGNWKPRTPGSWEVGSCLSGTVDQFL